MFRSLLTCAACVVAFGIALPLAPGRAAAQGCGAGDCLGPGQTTTASVTVQHYEQVDPTTVREVEPDSGETIEVTAYWDVDALVPGFCDCYRTASATVDVDVDWNETTDSWDATCTGCDATNGPIYSVTVCHSDGCGSGVNIDNAWEYELIVNMVPTNGTCQGNAGEVSGVLFETTSVDDGDAIRTSTCSEWYSVSPTSQTFSVSDLGPFECTYTCAAASGPTLMIEYQ